MIFISLSLFIVAVYGTQNAIVTIPSDVCDCGQISSQLDCTLANRCVWDFKSSSCGSIKCTAIQDQYSCAINSQCYWNGSTCTELKNLKCSSITLNSAQGLSDCNMANIFCVNYSTTTTTTCKNRSSVSTTCSSFPTATKCAENGLACKWEPAAGGQGQCSQIGCPNLKTQEDCLYFATNPTYKTLQLCTWQSGTCIPATTSQVAKYSYNTCFLNTLGTSTFSSNKVNNEGSFSGYCMSCFDLILSGLIVLGALII